MANLTEIGAEYSAAKSVLIDAEFKARGDRSKLQSMQSDRQAAQSELDKLLELEQSEHVMRVLDGDQAAPRKPKRLTRIANLRETVAGIDLALPIQKTRIAEAEQVIAEARQSVAEAILPSVFELKSERLARCADPLKALLEAMTDAAAVDVLQQKISGANGQIVLRGGIETTKLFSAGTILVKFKEVLPERFKQLVGDYWSGIDASIARKADQLAHEIGV